MIKIVCGCGREIKMENSEIIEKSTGITTHYEFNLDEGEVVLMIECECGNEDYIV